MKRLNFLHFLPPKFATIDLRPLGDPFEQARFDIGSVDMIHLICPNPALDRTLLVDSFQLNKPIRPLEVKDFPGGKSFNVAYALSYHGVKDYAIHTILGGPIGDYIQSLNQDLANPLYVTPTEGNTRTCNIYIHRETGDQMLFYEQGIQAQPALVDSYLKQVESVLQEGDFVVFSGSLLKGLPDGFLKDFIDAHPQQKVIIDCSGPALRLAYQSYPALIKINNEEYQDIHSDLDGDSLEDILAHLKQETHPYMIITLGAKGSLVKAGQAYYHIQTPPIQLVNPIAAGDFYLGLVVRGMYLDLDPLVYLKEAAAFSAANCMNLYPQVKQADYQALLESVRIEEV